MLINSKKNNPWITEKWLKDSSKNFQPKNNIFRTQIWVLNKWKNKTKSQKITKLWLIISLKSRNKKLNYKWKGKPKETFHYLIKDLSTTLTKNGSLSKILSWDFYIYGFKIKFNGRAIVNAPSKNVKLWTNI